MNSGNRSRACEGCKIRKVKCDGGQPCLQCAHLEVSCIVRPPTKRRNPIRGRLVAKLRGEESDFHGAKDASLSPNPTLPWVICGPASDIGHGNRLLQEDLLVGPLGVASGYTARFFTDLLPEFERIVYPVNPVISPGEIGEAIVNMGNSFEDFSLVHSFGAITIFLTQTTSSLSPDVSARMNELMQLSLEAHKRGDIEFGRNGYLTGEVPVSMKRIMTCIYLEVAMMSFRRLDRSFYLLREAIGMLQIFKATQFSPGSLEAARFERAYWEAFIHERFLTITAGYPSILLPLQFGILDHDPSLQPHVERGFSCLISLFSIVDRPFLAYWTRKEGNGETIPELTAEWIENKQAQLDDHEAIATQVDHELQTDGHGALTELQHADIFITRLWLRTILWQLALSNGLLHGDPKHDTHDGLSLHFPAQRLSIQLHNLVTRLENLASISTHGSGITQKLFEITSTIADVLAVPLGYDQSDHERDTQVKKFVFLAEVLIDFQRIRDYQKQYLRGKLDTVRRKYPALPDYIPPTIASEVEGTATIMK